MSEYTGPDQRKPLPPAVTATAAYGLTIGLGIATAHWLMKCYASHDFNFIPPDDALIEMWIVAILPTVHLIGRIITHHLQRLDPGE